MDYITSLKFMLYCMVQKVGNPRTGMSGFDTTLQCVQQNGAYK